MAQEKTRKKMKQSVGSRIFDICNISFMVLFCITYLRSPVNTGCLFHPFINREKIIPNNDSIVNRKTGRLRTITGTALHILVCCMAAYALTRTNMPFRRLITAVLLIDSRGEIIPAFYHTFPVYIGVNNICRLISSIVIQIEYRVKAYAYQAPDAQNQHGTHGREHSWQSNIKYPMEPVSPINTGCVIHRRINPGNCRWLVCFANWFARKANPEYKII